MVVNGGSWLMLNDLLMPAKKGIWPANTTTCGDVLNRVHGCGATPFTLGYSHSMNDLVTLCKFIYPFLFVSITTGEGVVLTLSYYSHSIVMTFPFLFCKWPRSWIHINCTIRMFPTGYTVVKLGNIETGPLGMVIHSYTGYIGKIWETLGMDSWELWIYGYSI